MAIILGVDPGLTGALAFFSTASESFKIFDMPTLRLTRNGKNKNELDLYALARILDNVPHVTHAYIERVSSMPGQGVSSVFSFGKSTGAILGIIAANFIPMTEVPPVTWKRGIGIATGSGKDASRALISRLYPIHSDEFARVKDNGRAEAALIALWGAKQTRSIAA